MFVTKEFTFDAAHFLTKYYGKCERMHGHTYKLQVTVEGKVQDNGLVIDFVLLKRIVQKHVLEKLDHQLLNDVVSNPSAENLVLWIWDKLNDLRKLLSEELQDPNLAESVKKYFDEKVLGTSANTSDETFDDSLKLYEIKLWETAGSCITYRGE